MAKLNKDTKKIIYIGLGITGGVLATAILVRMIAGGTTTRPSLRTDASSMNKNPTPNATPNATPNTTKNYTYPSVSVGRLTKKEIEAVQRYLIRSGYNLGAYGPNRDGVDGDAGTATKNAVAKEGYNNIKTFYDEKVNNFVSNFVSAFSAGNSTTTTESGGRTQALQTIVSSGKYISDWCKLNCPDEYMINWAKSIQNDSSTFMAYGTTHTTSDGKVR